MSRLYFTVTMKHSSLGVDLPVLSIETADHTGGFYHIKGLHPASIAALGGKGPEIQKQERFDVKCNVNKKRTCVSLIVNTTKHLPHVDWNSDTGAGPLPIGLSTLIPMLTGTKSSSKSKLADVRQSGSERSRSQRSSSSRRARDSHHYNRYDDHYEDRYDDKYDDRDDDRHDEKYDRYEDRHGKRKDHYDDRRERRRSESDSRSRR